MSARILPLAFLLLAGFLPCPGVARAESAAPLAVIYPRVREPYRAAFVAIVAGVEAELGARVRAAEVDPSETAQQIAGRIAGDGAGGVLLLGKYGLDVSHDLDPTLPRTVGAVLARPDDLPSGARGISMIPAPTSLFRTLRTIAPEVSRITVVHGADENDWLVERARADAAALGYGFTALRRETLREGASTYRELLGTLQSPVDALWLPQGSPFVAESSVLQMILRAAWDRNIVVFSSNVSHVPKGALFALFPDNTEMGRALARLATGAGETPAGLQVLEQLDTAINIRTANHLGLGLSAGDTRFDMVFPSR